MAGPADVAFTCSVCGTLTRASVATGRLHRHQQKGAAERCPGSRRAVFNPGQPDKRRDGTPNPDDHAWFARRPLSIPAARLKPADIATAQRLLDAAGDNPRKYGFMREPLRGFLDYARAARPDLFKRKQAMRVRRPAAPIAPEANPAKKLNKPRTDPAKRIWYREVLVGKRN